MIFDSLSLSQGDVRALLGAANADAALLYIYILSHSGEIDVESAAKRLSFSADRIYSALDVLSDIGLIGKSSHATLRERGDEIPEYSQRDVAEHMGYSKPSVSRAVGLLKQGGYVTTDEDG